MPMLRLVGPREPSTLGIFYRTEAFLYLRMGGATELHLPELISTNLLSKIWLSLLIVRFLSFCMKSFVFFLSSLLFLSILPMLRAASTYAALAW